MKKSKRAATILPFYVMELLARAQQLEEEGKEIIHMEVGEPDFPTPDRIITAGIEFLKTGAVHYTPAAGLPALREKIAGYYGSRHSVKISSSRIFITPGASGALLLVLAALLDVGDEVLLADPGYPCNRNFIRLLEGKSQLVKVDSTSGYQLNEALIGRYWSENSKGVLIASPSNPTGTLICKADMEQLIQAVQQRDGFVISDEIYHGLTYAAPAVSALEISDEAFVINSFSKQFGMTGWRLGWAVVPEPFIDVVERLAQNIFIAAATHSQQAALAAFDIETMAELERRRVLFKERRDFLYKRLIDIGFSVPILPEGAFYIYADCSHFTNDAYSFCMRLLEEEGVAITPGRDFGENSPSTHIRFAYTTSIENIAAGMDKLAAFAGRYGE